MAQTPQAVEAPAENGKRKVVVIIRERGGASVAAVFSSESAAGSFIRARIAKGTTVHADEASAWDGLHERLEMKRINHQEAYPLPATGDSDGYRCATCGDYRICGTLR